MQIFKNFKMLYKQSQQFLKITQSPKYKFAQLSHTEELKALSEILGMKNQKVNEEIANLNS